MSKTFIEKNQYLSKYSKNKKMTDEFIEKYRNLTKGTVEHILQISECVRDIKFKEKSGELNDYDMKYFCHSIGITEGSSTFRKFMCISERVDVFRKYLDKLPDSYTVLYQITTLDPDKFEELMSNNLINSYVTLKDIKRLGNKLPSSKFNSNELIFTVKFDLKSFPKDELKKLKTVIKYLYQISQKNIIEFNVPKDQIGKFGLTGSWDPEKKCWIKEEDRKINQPIIDEEFLKLDEKCSSSEQERK